MIKKRKKFRHLKKAIDAKQEKEISKVKYNRYLIEKIDISGETLEIRRPMSFLEAKELFFEKINNEML
ncbi:hypothetical protein JXB41_06010 [Candidatus Woesearchaeota archaeon]|nr:hypothetical protein [Candidatus Woesearchaeota archaeon]